MKKIEKLTEEQLAMMKPWTEKWIEIGLKTGGTDWKTFEENIRLAYEKTGIVFPKNIIRVHSPMVGAFAAAISNEILKSDAVGYAVRVAVDGAVGDAVGVAVHDAVGVAVHDAVVDAVDVAVGDAVHDAVGDAVDVAVHDAVRDAVRVAVGDAVGGAVKNIKWHDWFGGQFWVGGWWGAPGYVSFFTDICGLTITTEMSERAKIYQKLCESVNYFWTNRDFVMVCARPTRISLNDRGQLHNDTEKAIIYPDGWGIYSINGVTVPEIVVKYPEKITINMIQAEKNLEIQRIMVERFGVDKYLIETGAEVIDTDIRGIEGGGARCLLHEKSGRQWLICTDGSTERIYYLSVSDNAKSCKSAHEELCGFNEKLI